MVMKLRLRVAQPAVDRARCTLRAFLERERESLKDRWAMLLTLIACFVVALVVADQGSTIDRQQNLIRDLWNDSKQLTVMRMQQIRRQQEQAKAEDKGAAGDSGSEKPEAGKARKSKPGKKAEAPASGDKQLEKGQPDSSAPQHTEWPNGVRVQQAI